jgi:hypothetical protein
LKLELERKNSSTLPFERDPASCAPLWKRGDRGDLDGDKGMMSGISERETGSLLLINPKAETQDPKLFEL